METTPAVAPPCAAGAASAIARLVRRKASRACRSSRNISTPRSIRRAAASALFNSACAVARRLGCEIAARVAFCGSIHWLRYACGNAANFAHASAPSAKSARTLIPSSTFGIVAGGSTRSTSARGTQHVRATRHTPSSRHVSVDTLWPTEYSPQSRYCRSATSSSQSLVNSPRMSGRAKNGTSA